METEPLFGIHCPVCGLESYRGLPEDLADKIITGHRCITHHEADKYRIDFDKPLGYTSQTRMTEQQIIDLLA